MKKSKIATIVMFVSLVLFLALFVIFFNVADGFKATYDANNTQLLRAGTTISDRLALRVANGQLNAQYRLFSVLSYASSILAIASLGIGLAVSDKFKEAEEKKAEQE